MNGLFVARNKPANVNGTFCRISIRFARTHTHSYCIYYFWYQLNYFLIINTNLPLFGNCTSSTNASLPMIIIRQSIEKETLARHARKKNATNKKKKTHSTMYNFSVSNWLQYIIMVVFHFSTRKSIERWIEKSKKKKINWTTRMSNRSPLFDVVVAVGLFWLNRLSTAVHDKCD